MKDSLELAADNYVKALLREDYPEKTEEEIEELFEMFIKRPKQVSANQNAA